MSHVQSEFDRMFVTDAADTIPQMQRSRAMAMLGLYHLKRGDFFLASQHFVGVERMGDFNRVLTARDVGVYGCLTAMASLDRKGLQIQILDRLTFQMFLNKTPTIKQLVLAMFHSKYNELMKGLDNITKDLQLDIYLAPVLEKLLQSIRAKALLQYFKPFSSMDLNRMAKDFGVSLGTMEDELHVAIQNGKIQAKIDLAKHILLATRDKVDQSSVLRQILTESEGFCRDASVVLNNLAMQKNKLKLTRRINMDDFSDEPSEGGSKFSKMMPWRTNKPRNRKGMK